MSLSFILTAEFNEMSLESCLVYSVLRADVSTGYTGTAAFRKDEMVSGLAVQSIAQLLKIPPETISRALEDLCKRRILVRESDGLFKLGQDGKFYFENPITYEKPQYLTAIDKIRKAAKEGAARLKAEREKSRLSTETKNSILTQILGDQIQNPEDRQAVLSHFELEYFKKYKEKISPPASKSAESCTAQKNMYANRAIQHFGTNLDELKRMIEFAVRNWEQIHASRISSDIKPTYATLGNKTFWTRVQFAEVNGFTEFKDKKGPKFVAEYFEKRHRTKWGYPPKAEAPSPDKHTVLKYKFTKAALDHFDGDSERLLKIIDFIFDNFEKLHRAYGWKESSPGWRLFNSPKFLDWMEDISKKGIQEREWSR